MRFRLLPSDDRFFDLFNEAAVNAAECARYLRDLINDDSGVRANDGVMRSEHRGDELTDEILQRLNTSFVTPFDREDIHALAEELDDVVDDMLEVAYRLQLGDRDVALMPELKQQADVLVQMGEEVVAMIAGLEPM